MVVIDDGGIIVRIKSVRDTGGGSVSINVEIAYLVRKAGEMHEITVLSSARAGIFDHVLAHERLRVATEQALYANFIRVLSRLNEMYNR